MASKKMKDMLNQAIAREIQVSIQYMWQHVQWAGIDHFAVSEKFKEIAVEEMKHAESLAERLWYFGGVPTTKPSTITVGGELWEMVDLDIEAETEAIALYRKLLKVAEAENDPTTKKLIRGILADEEEHDDFFRSIKEGKRK